MREVPLLCLNIYLQVRIRGYRTISAVSKVQPKWVKRNADVLVQLLQSGTYDCD